MTQTKDRASADRAATLSKNARVVLAVVSEQPLGVHAPAHDIYVQAKRRQASLGVSTVYRALDRLIEAGLVHAVRVPGAASALYEPARLEHAHFQCATCGRVEDIDYDLPAADVDRLNATHHLTITGVTLTFSGRCAACRDQTPI